MKIYNKDEEFVIPDENPRIRTRKGGAYSNTVGGGIKIAFMVSITDYLVTKQTGLNFEELSDQVIKRAVADMHNNNKWECLLYEWNGIEFEQVNPKEQNWFVCSDNSND